MPDEIKDIMIDCPVCEKETKITVREMKLAIQHRKETGGLVLVSCTECCRALVLPDDIPRDGVALEEWFVEAAEDPDNCCACIPMLDPDQEKIPAGAFDDLGVIKYRPGGGGPVMRKRPYMYAYGIDPACHLKKNPSMGANPFKVGK
jgi:hypothetical protein